MPYWRGGAQKERVLDRAERQEQGDHDRGRRGMNQAKDRENERTEPDAGTESGAGAESEEVAIRRRQALERLGKIAVYTTPLIVGLLSSDAWAY